jgi:hypothetical protein
MSKHQKNRLWREIENNLKAMAVPYSIVSGSKHCKVFVREQFVGIFSRNADGHNTDLIMRNVRKCL